jgi:hypothetical protein
MAAIAEQHAALANAEQLNIEASELIASMWTEIERSSRRRRDATRNSVASERSNPRRREVQAHAAIVEELRTELKMPRRWCAAVEQGGQDSGATNVRLQAQMTALLSELLAAREVGRTALETLRCNVAARPEMSQKSATFVSMLRRFGFLASDHFPLL